nr:MAG TPA: hypothetical protein [Bacteriophage sp.]
MVTCPKGYKQFRLSSKDLMRVMFNDYPLYGT